MRIVKRLEFMALPAGTLYREVRMPDENLQDLRVKGETLGTGKDDGGWNYTPLDQAQITGTFENPEDIIAEAIADDREFTMDYKFPNRDGMFHKDNEVLYMVYSRTDAQKLIDFLTVAADAAEKLETRRAHSVSEETRELAARINKEHPELKKELRNLKSQLKAPHWLSAIGSIAVGEEPTEGGKEAIDNISATITRMLKFDVFKTNGGVDQFVDYLAGAAGFFVTADPDLVKIFVYDEVPDIKFTGNKAIDRLKPNRKVGE
jgi:hypothetical protein